MTKPNTTKTEAPKVDEAVAQTTAKIAEVSKSSTALFGALGQFGRKYVEGMIEVDKALFGYARESVNNMVQLGRDTMSAKSVDAVLDLHVAAAHNRIENTAANTREVLDLTQAKLKEAVAPVKEVVAPYLPKGKKAA